MSQPNKTINVYCDESCHLSCDESKVMTLGALYCPEDKVQHYSIRLREIKREFLLSSKYEAKWSKISASKKDYYQRLVEFFFQEPTLKFRGVIIPNKNILDHQRFSQTHDDWYYKMYYQLLVRIINPVQAYHFYLDIKDTQGGPKTRELQKFLAKKYGDVSKECVARVQQIRSHESELLQVCDVFTGALAYSNRGLQTNSGKLSVIEDIKQHLPYKSLSQTTAYHYHKFNFLVWDAS